MYSRQPLPFNLHPETGPGPKDVGPHQSTEDYNDYIAKRAAVEKPRAPLADSTVRNMVSVWQKWSV